ncbi:hypothetical protein D9M69_728180 [compost metagenome]
MRGDAVPVRPFCDGALYGPLFSNAAGAAQALEPRLLHVGPLRKIAGELLDQCEANPARVQVAQH